MPLMRCALPLVIIGMAPAFAQRVEPPQERGIYHAAAFPTKPGVYQHKGWRYEYTVEGLGTRSERRVGRLFLGDEEVKGDRREILEEFLGRFVWFGTKGYNRGWLNTLTYDRPVFDNTGSLTSAAREALSQSHP